MINEKLKEYINEFIIPSYENFDNAHNIDHVNKVIDNSLEIARDYNVNLDMVYVVAAYHDTGLVNGRENHHIDSGDIVLKDKKLSKWFTYEQIQVISEAVVDHRASNDYEPRSIYGKIVAEADRDINYNTIIKRTIDYSLYRYSNYTKEQHVKRTINHIEEKYGENGYLKLWLKTKKNINELNIIHRKIKNQEELIKDINQYLENDCEDTNRKI